MLRSFGECCKNFLSRAPIRRYRFRRHGPALDGAIVFAQPSAGLKLERLAAALAGVLGFVERFDIEPYSDFSAK